METGSQTIVEVNVESGEELIPAEVILEPVVGITPEKVEELTEEFEMQMSNAPLILDEVGYVEEFSSVDTLKKAAYYLVYGLKKNESDSIGDAVKNVHIARFESKAQLKKIIDSLDSNGLKLIDILKGRPLQFQVKVKRVSEITIGK